MTDLRRAEVKAEVHSGCFGCAEGSSYLSVNETTDRLLCCSQRGLDSGSLVRRKVQILRSLLCDLSGVGEEEEEEVEAADGQRMHIAWLSSRLLSTSH